MRLIEIDEPIRSPGQVFEHGPSHALEIFDEALDLGLVHPTFDRIPLLLLQAPTPDSLETRYAEEDDLFETVPDRCIEIRKCRIHGPTPDQVRVTICLEPIHGSGELGFCKR